MTRGIEQRFKPLLPAFLAGPRPNLGYRGGKATFWPRVPGNRVIPAASPADDALEAGVGRSGGGRDDAEQRSDSLHQILDAPGSPAHALFAHMLAEHARHPIGGRTGLAA